MQANGGNSVVNTNSVELQRKCMLYVSLTSDIPQFSNSTFANTVRNLCATTKIESILVGIAPRFDLIYP